MQRIARVRGRRQARAGAVRRGWRVGGWTHIGCAAVSVEIRRVEGKGDRKQFLDLPYRLYATEDRWVPPLRIERRVVGRDQPFRCRGRSGRGTIRSLGLGRHSLAMVAQSSGRCSSGSVSGNTFAAQAAEGAAITAQFVWLREIRSRNGVTLRDVACCSAPASTSGAMPWCQIWRPSGVSHSEVPRKTADPSVR